MNTPIGVQVPSSLLAGDALPTFEMPPVSRLALALYCGASGDHNPVHVDIDFAKASGMPDVFAHGMLSMAWLGQVLTRWVPQQAILSFNVRFAAITHVGERITCAGKVLETLERDGKRLARVALSTTNPAGQLKLEGEALINLDLRTSP